MIIGIEQADIEHQPEVKDGEDDHDADRGDPGDAHRASSCPRSGTGTGQKRPKKTGMRTNATRTDTRLVMITAVRKTAMVHKSEGC